MKSPLTGTILHLRRERRQLAFRKDRFEIVHHAYVCENGQESFTSTSLDELNTVQLYNRYREKYNIPFADEIKQTRKRYGLTAAKMSEILGFGANSYRQYEAGEMPSVANAKLIKIAADPERFLEMLEWCPSLGEKAKAQCRSKVLVQVELEHKNQLMRFFKEYLMGSLNADLYSGYKAPSLEKLTEMVVFFAESLAPYKTKMNKLLFYADFAMFQKHGFSMSGTRYRAIEMGPVPHNFQSVFEYISNQGQIRIQAAEFSKGYTGEQFLPAPNRAFNSRLFSEQELQILHKVAQQFKEDSSRQLVEISHTEEAWEKNQSMKAPISYELAFNLKNIELE
jgi:uncharacterized phage-associated protein